MGGALLVELSYARAGLVIDASHLSWRQPYEKILITGSKFFPLRDLGRVCPLGKHTRFHGI